MKTRLNCQKPTSLSLPPRLALVLLPATLPPAHLALLTSAHRLSWILYFLMHASRLHKLCKHKNQFKYQLSHITQYSSLTNSSHLSTELPLGLPTCTANKLVLYSNWVLVSFIVSGKFSEYVLSAHFVK